MCIPVDPCASDVAVSLLTALEVPQVCCGTWCTSAPVWAPGPWARWFTVPRTMQTPGPSCSGLVPSNSPHPRPRQVGHLSAPDRSSAMSQLEQVLICSFLGPPPCFGDPTRRPAARPLLLQTCSVHAALESLQKWLQTASTHAAEDADAARFCRSLQAHINLCHLSMLGVSGGVGVVVCLADHVTT